MESSLVLVTALVNFFALTISLWLGLYIVLRSRRTLIVWLAALTLWSVATWFLHNLLLSGLPDQADINLRWLDAIGQLIKFAPPLWFHLSVCLYLEVVKPPLLWRRFAQFSVALAYALALFQILESELYRGLGGFAPRNAAVLQFRDRWISPSYPLFLAMVVTLPLLALLLLWQTRRRLRSSLLRRQVEHLLWATGVAYLAGLYAGWAVYFGLDLPAYPADMLLGASVVFVGYSVARYNALIEGRPMARDALLSLIGLGAIILVYSVTALFLHSLGQMSSLAYLVILVCAIIAHTLYDGGRALLDRLFFRNRFRQFRADLRQLADEAGTGETLAEQLSRILEALRRERGIRHGWIAVRQNEQTQEGEPAHFVVQAATDGASADPTYPSALLTAADVVELNGVEGAAAALPGLALLVPIYSAGRDAQVGALALGPKESGERYGSADLVALDTLAYRLAAVIHAAKQQEAQAEQLEQEVGAYRQREREMELQVQRLLAEREQPAPAPSVLGHRSEEERFTLVEQALRRLHKYAFLGELPLAGLPMVDHILAERQAAGELTTVTHVDRGKALHQVLVQAIEKLRPAGPEPNRYAAPREEWHDYLILHASYVRGEKTGDIQSWLYIGEGTYNRTRREALESVTKILCAMESGAAPTTLAGFEVSQPSFRSLSDPSHQA
jgi:hypothetical protein